MVAYEQMHKNAFPYLDKKELMVLLKVMREYSDIADVHVGMLRFIKRKRIITALRTCKLIHDQDTWNSDRLKKTVTDLLRRFEQLEGKYKIVLSERKIVKKFKRPSRETIWIMVPLQGRKVTVNAYISKIKKNTFLVSTTPKYVDDVVQYLTYHYGRY